MHVVFPSRSPIQQRDDSACTGARAAEEQAFYDCYGADSIVGFFRCIEALSALGEAQILRFGRLALGGYTMFLPASGQCRGLGRELGDPCPVTGSDGLFRYDPGTADAKDIGKSKIR